MYDRRLNCHFSYSLLPPPGQTEFSQNSVWLGDERQKSDELSSANRRTIRLTTNFSGRQMRINIFIAYMNRQFARKVKPFP